MTWADLATHLAREGKVPRFAIRLDDGDWQDTTAEGYVAAEKEAGMTGPDHRDGQPATYAFVGYFTHGYGFNAVRIRVEGKVVL